MRMPLRFVLVVGLLVFVSMGCGPGGVAAPDASIGPFADGGGTDAAIPMDGGVWDGGSVPSDGSTGGVDASGSLPITVPDRTWTFVPVAGARCADGSDTGIGLRTSPGSRDVLVYFQGGGACATGDNCWGDGPGGAANVDGYGEAELRRDLGNDYALFDTSAGGGNPFRAMHMVFMPYCTGDGHAGEAVRELEVTGSTPRVTHFVGALNVRAALDRLAVTFPDVERVFVVGTSAGGGGATFHYARVRAAFGATTHLIVDSAPGIESEDDADRWRTWGIVPPCDGCSTAADVRRYDRSLDPDARYGYLGFRYDATMANGLGPAEFDAALTSFLDEVRAEATSRTFVVDNSDTMFTTTLHVVTTKNRPPALRSAYLSWLSALVAGSGWENVTVTPP